VTDPALTERANDIIERLFTLDEAVANGRAFRALLEDLHARNLTVVEEPHVTAISMVRAEILRAAIGTVMACLDPRDWGGNRASVGQILDMLKVPDWLRSSRGQEHRPNLGGGHSAGDA
jgi:hypothetical protein